MGPVVSQAPPPPIVRLDRGEANGYFRCSKHLFGYRTWDDLNHYLDNVGAK